ncbi:MAG: 3-oxoacyl-ACP synthase III [Planctomycetes bacterium]|nr:3-oxoacyl-ACP synthase III [Planctomycetota bacterium]
MRYARTWIEALGYELPANVISSAAIEDRLAPLYRSLHVSAGQLESWTGIRERRWWDAGARLSNGGLAAARKALAASRVRPEDIGILVYAGVCRENFEPATACAVAHGLGVSRRAEIYDVSNACLGVLNGILDVANRIELGQVRAGLVVSCESAREINEIAITRMLAARNMDAMKACLATLTGGSGAVAVLVTDGSFGSGNRRKLVGGACRAAPEHHGLCRWGVDRGGAAGDPTRVEIMETDAIAVLRNGVALGRETWEAFLAETGWTTDGVDRVICHQVGSANRDAMLGALGIPVEKDFSTFEFLGNMGTVSLPLTAALAEEREFLTAGDRVAWLGIGSGLNCLMLAIEW